MSEPHQINISFKPLRQLLIFHLQILFYRVTIYRQLYFFLFLFSQISCFDHLNIVVVGLNLILLFLKSHSSIALNSPSFLIGLFVTSWAKWISDAIPIHNKKPFLQRGSFSLGIMFAKSSSPLSLVAFSSILRTPLPWVVQGTPSSMLDGRGTEIAWPVFVYAVAG